MALLSKCHLCLQHQHSIGKQPINILVGGISYKKRWRFVFSGRDVLCFYCHPGSLVGGCAQGG